MALPYVAGFMVLRFTDMFGRELEPKVEVGIGAEVEPEID